MAAVVPILSIVGGATAATTAFAAGAVTFGGFLSIAGGLASAIGMLTKEKDLTKLGGILSLAGGVTNAITGANAAGNAATATGDAAETAKGLTGQLPEGSESLLTSPGAQAQPMPTMGKLAGAADTVGTSAMTGIDAAGNVSAPMGGGMGTPGPSIADSLMGRTQANVLTGGGAPVTPGVPPMSDFLSEAAKGMTSGDVSGAVKNLQTQAGTLWDRATGAVGKASEWVQKNPMAAAFALQGISGTMAAKVQQDALDFQKSLIERARANLNSPVRMSFTPGG